MLKLKFSNFDFECGPDEAGRGCLAGPVTAAAVILPVKFTCNSINDSKQLSSKKRELIKPIIELEAISFGVAHIFPKKIDEINILNASIMAMHNSISKLKKVEFISVDGNEDSFAELDEYATSYHPDFIGITGNPDNIFEVVDEYGAYFSPTELRDVDPSRAYRHSSRYYIIDQQGDIIDAMRHSATANEIVARLRTLI